MGDSQFPHEHKAQFQQLLEDGELYALNRHIGKRAFGPWLVNGDGSDPDAVTRLKTRFRAAVREAAIVAGAPSRVNLLDWWIRKLARGKMLHFIEGLIQRSAEYCEELKSNAVELRALTDDSTGRLGLAPTCIRIRPV